MSVDKTIEELSGTLAQLGILVEHINTQIVGITSRINITLDNFDSSVAGIASDAGVMTGQVSDTISQVPNAWIFYLLFLTLIIVLILLSILIAINLATKIHAIYRIIRGEATPTSTPLPSVAYSDSKEPLNIQSYPASPLTKERIRQFAVPMETEPRRYGQLRNEDSPRGGAGQQFSTGFSGTPSYTAVDYSRKRQQDPGGGGGTALDSAFSHRSPDWRPDHFLLPNGRTRRSSRPSVAPPTPAPMFESLCASFVHHHPAQSVYSAREDHQMTGFISPIPSEISEGAASLPPAQTTTDMRKIVSIIESTTPTGEPYLRRQYTPAPTSTAVEVPSDSTRYTSAASSGNYPTYLSARAEPV